MLERLIESFLGWKEVRTAQKIVKAYESSSDESGRLGYNKNDHVMAHEVVEAYVTLSLERI